MGCLAEGREGREGLQLSKHAIESAGMRLPGAQSSYPTRVPPPPPQPLPLLFLAQSEVRRAPKNFWRPLPPYLKVWILHCCLPTDKLKHVLKSSGPR